MGFCEKKTENTIGGFLHVRWLEPIEHVGIFLCRVAVCLQWTVTDIALSDYSM